MGGEYMNYTEILATLKERVAAVRELFRHLKR